MAECGGTTDNSSAPVEDGATGLGASPQVPLPQSKSLAESFLEFGQLEPGTAVGGEGKNSMCLICRTCRCKVLKPGFGTLMEREVIWCVIYFWRISAHLTY